MSAVHSILAEIARRGVTIRVDGETLRLRPRVALDDELLARIKEHKPEIIRAVMTQGCFQALHPDTGKMVKVHPSQPVKAAQKVERTCWHCSGNRKCSCIVCWDPRTDGPGECVPCHGRGTLWTWVQ